MNHSTPNDIETRDIRPVVAERHNNRPVLAFGGIALLSAGLLFYSLESKRTSPKTVFSLSSDMPPGSMISSPPDFQIPTDSHVVYEHARASTQPEGDTNRVRRSLSPVPRDQADATRVLAQPSPYVASIPSEPQRQALREGTGGSVVFDASPAMQSPNISGQVAAKQIDRVIATNFRNPSTTIPLGTVMQAVLETALDSNRAGFVRAIVSNDIFGFDGSRVLVPKGSRLIGEYKAELGAGQNRALVQWQRLMRPDGVIIDINSPAADPLGRAGVRGKVNSHFLERFGGSILQSTLDLGVQLATRRVARDTVVVALPGTASATAAPTIANDRVQRTLTVKQGSSVSVFVSRDLDFSSVAS